MQKSQDGSQASSSSVVFDTPGNLGVLTCLMLARRVSEED
jgi:hypothetical protein